MSTVFRDVEVDGRRCDVRIDDEVVAEIGPAGSLGADRVVVGDGGALIPGLHDHHIHLAATAAARSSLDVGPRTTPSLDQLAARLADATPRPDGWIRAVGYHESVAGDLDRWVLDRLRPDVPVRVQHRSGALWMLNTAAIEAVGGLDDAPPGVERSADGTATGRLFRLDDWLRQRLPRSPSDLGTLGRLLRDQGITAVTDATAYPRSDDFAPLAAAVARGELAVHVAVTGHPALDAPPPDPLIPGPAKILPDHDPPVYDDLVADIRSARRQNRAVAVHCVTREALVVTIAALREVGPHPGDRIEHGAVVPEELFDDLRQLGLRVVTQPGFVATRGDDYLADVDPADVPDLWRCASLLGAGIPVAAGTDAPFGPLDPWAAIAAAVTRRTPSGRVLGPAETVTPRQALDLFLAPLDDPGGRPRTVHVGAPADLCLLDRPLADALAEPDAAHVVTTTVAGTTGR